MTQQFKPTPGLDMLGLRGMTRVQRIDLYLTYLYARSRANEITREQVRDATKKFIRAVYETRPTVVFEVRQ